MFTCLVKQRFHFVFESTNENGGSTVADAIAVCGCLCVHDGDGRPGKEDMILCIMELSGD